MGVILAIGARTHPRASAPPICNITLDYFRLLLMIGHAIELHVSMCDIVSLGASLAVVDFGCVMVTAHSGCTCVSAMGISEQLNHGDMAFHLIMLPI